MWETVPGKVGHPVNTLVLLLLLLLLLHLGHCQRGVLMGVQRLLGSATAAVGKGNNIAELHRCACARGGSRNTSFPLDCRADDAPVVVDILERGQGPRERSGKLNVVIRLLDVWLWRCLFLGRRRRQRRDEVALQLPNDGVRLGLPQNAQQDRRRQAMVGKGPRPRGDDGELVHGEKHLDGLGEVLLALVGEELLLLRVEAAIAAEQGRPTANRNRVGRVKADCKVLQPIEGRFASFLVPQLWEYIFADPLHQLAVLQDLAIGSCRICVGIESLTDYLAELVHGLEIRQAFVFRSGGQRRWAAGDVGHWGSAWRSGLCLETINGVTYRSNERDVRVSCHRQVHLCAYQCTVQLTFGMSLGQEINTTAFVLTFPS